MGQRASRGLVRDLRPSVAARLAVGPGLLLPSQLLARARASPVRASPRAVHARLAASLEAALVNLAADLTVANQRAAVVVASPRAAVDLARADLASPRAEVPALTQLVPRLLVPP